jgi:hypothetical protein
MNSYLGLFNDYQDRIIMILSAHAHPGEIRAPVSSRYPDLSLVLMMTPSISPLGFIQPAYTILDLKTAALPGNKPAPSAIWRFF